MGGSLLLILGIGLVGAGFLMREAPLPDGFSWKPPLAQVRNADLTPATVLLPLTGTSSVDALSAALDGGHWENAYALIAYDASMSDPARIGALLQLGSRYDAARDRHKAAWCYLYAARIAVLSPSLSDAVRADTLLQASTGLRAVGASSAARLMADQAFLVAQHSPELGRESQSRRLTQVGNAYAALGANDLATKAREIANEPVASVVDAGTGSRVPFMVQPAELPASEEVRLATLTRMAAAKQLHDDVSGQDPNGPVDWPQDSLNQLRDALEQEDQARQAYYDQQTAIAKGPAEIALMRERVNWLGLKHRIAEGAFGIALVPEWVKARSDIAVAWSDAWGELWELTRAQVNAVPNAQAISQANQDVLRQMLLSVRWGWYQGATEKELHDELSEIAEALRKADIPSLRLDSLTIAGRTTDWLVPDESFGKNELALPE